MVELQQVHLVGFRLATIPGLDPEREGKRVQAAGEVVTGLLYLDPAAETAPDDMHALSGTDPRPLVDIPYAELCPGAAALEELMGEFV